MSTETHNEPLKDFVFIDGAKLSKDKGTLVSYEGDSKYYEIQCGVRIIGEKAFAENTQIESVTVPETVKIIEKRAFEKCKALKQVVFKGKRTGLEIGDDCFNQCEALVDISIPMGTKAIGEASFQDCISLKQIHIPGSIQHIPKYAFYGCENLKDVVLSEGVKEIHSFSFDHCTVMEEIRLPYSMEYVASSSFSKLKRCYFENPKTVLEEDAFLWCGDDFRLFLPKGADIKNASKSMPKGFLGYNTNPEEGPIAYGHLGSNMISYMADIPIEDILKGSATIDNWMDHQSFDRKGGVYAYGKSCFLKLDDDYFRNNKHYSKSYRILDDTKYICDHAFQLNYDSGLDGEYSTYNKCSYEIIELPSSIIAIGNYSFAGCRELSTITLPENLSFIGKNPFVATWKLNTIVSKSPNYIVDSDCLISIESGTIIHCFHHVETNEEHSDSFTIPSCVNKLGDYSFAESISYVRELTIPDTVIHVGKGAFKENNNLIEVVFEGENTVIEDEAFRWCRNLKRILLPTGIKRIGNRLFEYCNSLAGITIPRSVKEIGDSVFYGCISLKTIEIPCSVEKIGVNPFVNSGVENLINHSDYFEYDNGILYTKNKRKIIACISKSEKIAIPPSVEEIGRNAFSKCEHLEEIKVPSSVKTIHQGAFSGCKALKKVDIGEGGINLIEKNTFSGCTSLQEFRIPDGVTEIGDFAFSGCKSLKTLYSSSTIKHVSIYAFDSHPCPIETTWLPWGIEKNGLPGQKKTMSLEECDLWMDDYGVVYSKDKKAVIKATKPLDKYFVLEGTTTIKQNAFSFTPWQRSLNEIHLPNSIERIEQGAFAFCDFSEISLPQSLEYIGQDMFVSCSNLKQIIIPPQVRIMDGNPFLHKNYELINNSNYFTLNDKILYSISLSKIISCLDTKSIKLRINGASSIGPYSFAYCNAKEIVIEPSIKVIEEKAFNEASVERVVLPDSLVEIKQFAFEMCLNLQEITIPRSTRFIGDCAFWGCLRKVTINSRNIKIGRDAFHSDKLTQIIVPLGCLDYYKTILPNYSNIIVEQ